MRKYCTRPRWIFLLLAALLIAGCLQTFAFFFAVSSGDEVIPVQNGQAAGTIVVSESASVSELWAAQDLASHFKLMSGATVPVITNSTLPFGPTIIIGNGGAAAQLGVFPDTALGDEGYRIKTAGNRMVIAGGRLRGTMYGVYTLLEQLGCRWWYPGQSTVPGLSTIRIGKIDLTEVPQLMYRDMLYGEMDNADSAMLWRIRNKVNGGFYKSNSSKYGGAVTFDTLVHSYDRLAPPATYFSAHPEYYAWRGGKRIQDQPCFSSTGMVQVMASALITDRTAHPEWMHFTVGQNDNSNYCQCEGCTALAQQYGLSGMQIDFASRIAEIVRATYPDVRINVPAYTWSRPVPAGGLSLPANMSTTLSSIECDFGQPLATGNSPVNSAFRKDIEDWGATSSRLLIWDYTTDFKHFLLPYPNYYVLTPNVKFFADHHANGIMHQGANTTRNSQFAGLYMWVLAKSLWNPEENGTNLVAEFMNGYYGPAGQHLLAFANEVHMSMQMTGTPLFVRWSQATYPNSAYLTPEIIEQAERHFAAAFESVKSDPELSRRVRYAYLQVQYVVLRRPRQLWPSVLKVNPAADWASYASSFTGTVVEAGCVDIGENLPARNFLSWAGDYGRARSASADFDLLRIFPTNTDFSMVTLIQAASFDTTTTLMKTNAAASDGWVQEVKSVGWSIQHRVAPPFDFTPGRTYKVFVRARAVIPEGTTGAVVQAGLYPKFSKKIQASEISSGFKNFEIGSFTASTNSVDFYICRDAQTDSVVSNAEVDCFWLQQVTP